MAKDPAFLFYHEDFFSGVSDMTNDEVGAYIKCMCVQASKGGISEKHMSIICNSHEVHTAVKNKFVLNTETGLLENLRLKLETIKRKKYSESRSQNRKKVKSIEVNDPIICETYDNHMVNEDDNVNEDVKEIKNGIKGGVKISINLVFPFDTENFKDQWGLWKDYKSKEFNFRFKSPQSEQASLKELGKLSSNNEINAVEIIHQSMSNGWKGFFELKKQNNGNTNNNQPKSIVERWSSIDTKVDKYFD